VNDAAEHGTARLDLHEVTRMGHYYQVRRILAPAPQLSGEWAELGSLDYGPDPGESLDGLRKRLMEPHHTHPGDGTVEGCPGCSAELPSITQEELAAALARVYGGSGAQIQARHIFTVARNMRAEAGQWVTGELYESRGMARPLNDDFTTGPPHEVRSVYRREPGGWYAYDGQIHVRDGSLDTSTFRRLVPEGEGL
jgi:hypothetical protein